MDSEMPYFLYLVTMHYASGSSCGILYILVLSLVLFIQSICTLRLRVFNLANLAN